MILSELQRILKQYQNEYGDLEIKMRYNDVDVEYDFSNRNIFLTSRDDETPFDIVNIVFWT